MSVGWTDPTKEQQVYARVATWEGGDADQVRASIAGIKEESASGPPEGFPAVGLLILHSGDGSKVLGITLFDTESDMKQGDETLNSMSPPGQDGMGKRTSVEMFEVGVKRDA